MPGTPGISDPGAWLAAQLGRGRRDGEHGARALVRPRRPWWSAACPPTASVVEGFLPRKGPERRRRIGALLADARTTVVLEAPSRVAATLAELADVDAERPVAVVRELTKVHEEVWRGTLAEAAAVFAEREVRGEVVLVIGGAPAPEPAGDEAVEAAVRAALDDDRRRARARWPSCVAAALGVARRRAYEAALRVRQDAGRRRGTSGPR